MWGFGPWTESMTGGWEEVGNGVWVKFKENDDRNRAEYKTLGNSHSWIVEDETIYVSGGVHTGARVIRMNSIGQGWGIGVYRYREQAEAVAKELARWDQVV